jgi:uncharacterized protein (TIGR03382 family)
MPRCFAPVVFILGKALWATTLSVGSADVIVGTTFMVPVRITDVSDLYAYQFDLSFDAGPLELLSITEGPLLGTAGPTFFTAGTIDNSAGVATFTGNTLLGNIPGVSGSGEIASLMFRAASLGISRLTLGNITLLDSQGFAFQGFEVEPGEARVTPEPGTAVLAAVALAWVVRRRFFRAAARLHSGASALGGAN